MTQYLYAAAVQGIQDFIFDTNRLKEIAGASEIVERICTTDFAKMLDKSDLANDPNLLVGAAGNIKYLFEEGALCRKVVLEFPFEIAKKYPGLSVSQTVVEIKNGTITKETIDQAERNLQSQRNLPTRPSTLSWMIAQRTAKTGKPAVGRENNKGDLLDQASLAKLEKAKDAQKSLFNKIIPKTLPDSLKKMVYFPTDIDRICSQENSWIAVIHADGNDLGKIIPQLFQNVSGKKLQELQHDFSAGLGQATEEAVQAALDKIFGRSDANLYYNQQGYLELPMRPVICGGDDLTVIIRAKEALEFTEIFLREFSAKTKEKLGKLHPKFEKGLTACAGIAYVKQKYPFHYAATLSEHLCKHAKNAAKKLGQELTPACISFYKIESSFVRDYEEILKEELTAAAIGTLTKCPYMLEQQANFKTVEDLQNWTSTAARDDYKSVTSRLRQVLSMLHTQDKETIQLELNRIEQIAKGKLKDFGIALDALQNNTLPDLSHLHDFLSIHSIHQ